MITAGHCVARARPSQVRVTLGEYVLKSNAEPLPGRTYGASNIKVHPYFKFTPQADRYDVAVVRLNRRVDMAPHISPLCLPPKSMDMHGLNGWASGWGALQPGSRLRPKTLQVSIVNYTKSLVNANPFYPNFTNTHFQKVLIPHLTCIMKQKYFH